MKDASESPSTGLTLLDSIKQKVSAYLKSSSDSSQNPSSGDVIYSDASESEATLLLNLNKLRSLTADELMVPRADIAAFKSDVKVDSVLNKVVKTRHTRYPVYKDTLDEVIGLVHVKDLLGFVQSNPTKAKKETTIAKVPGLMRDIPHISPSMRALDLLEEMRLKKAHMALVVDEYGGVDGLITIGDLLEEVVGELESSSPNSLEPVAVKNDDGTITADARVLLADICQMIQVDLCSEEEHDDIDTIGGFVFSLAGHMPSRGEIVKHEETGIEFEVTEVAPRRIKTITILAS